MPQLDLLILTTTCIETTFFFWLLYIIIVSYVLTNINILFKLRYYIRNQIILINWVKINKFFINNFKNFNKILTLKLIMNYNYFIKFLISKKPILRKIFNYLYYKRIYKHLNYILNILNVWKWNKN